MRLRRRKQSPAPKPMQADPTRIAVLEHDLLGVPPEPGTYAAALITIRTTGTCIEHQPVDISTLGDLPETRMLCTRCGNYLVPAGGGTWRIAGTG